MALIVYETEISVGTQTSTRHDVTWSHSSAQKNKRPYPGTQFFSQIPEGGEGNRGQIPDIYLGSPPLGLTLTDALIDRQKWEGMENS